MKTKLIKLKQRKKREVKRRKKKENRFYIFMKLLDINNSFQINKPMIL